MFTGRNTELENLRSLLQKNTASLVTVTGRRRIGKSRLIQDDLHYISKEDLDLFCVVDTATEAVKVIDEFYSKYLLSPNF